MPDRVVRSSCSRSSRCCVKAATSPVEEFTTGGFRPVLPDRADAPRQGVTRVLLASGKVVYDLEAEREKRGDTQTRSSAQLAPVPGRRR